MGKTSLVTDNAELLVYLDGQLHVTILGGIKLSGLDRMRVTLKMTIQAGRPTAFRHNLDLYNSIQVEQLLEKASEALDLGRAERCDQPADDGPGKLPRN